MKFPRVVVSGSIAFDHIMSMPGHFKDHILPDKIHAINVSFIMDSFRNEFGGTGGNMAYSLGLLKTPVLLVGSAGNDFSRYREHLQSISEIDLSGVTEYPNVTSAQGFVMTDRDDNQIWGFFEGAMKEEVHLSIRELISKEDFLIVGPTNPSAMMQFVNDAIAKKTTYLFDPAFNIPHFSDEDMAKAVEHAAILIGNDYEMEMIRRKVRLNDEDFYSMKRVVVTTFGSQGSEIKVGNQEIRIEVPKVENMLDPTGAGDAYRAGFVAGFVRELDLKVCGQMASIAAAYAIEGYGTQTHKYTVDEFKNRFKENYGSDLEII